VMPEELVPIVDDADRLIRIATRSEVKQKNLLHRASIVLVLSDDGWFFTHKRSPHKRVYPNLYAFGAGGGVQLHETYEQAAYRELYEELGCDTLPLTFLFPFQFRSTETQYNAQIFSIRSNGPFRLDPTEMEWGAFFPKEKIEQFIQDNKLTPDDIALFSQFKKHDLHQIT
jgi:8-oxo-dGTP pyrophosphatase MutT (NUDIX family)